MTINQSINRIQNQQAGTHRGLLLLVLALFLCAGAFAQNSHAARQSRNRAGNKEKSIQLYSLRELIGDADRFAKNHKTVLAKLKDQGYTSVEAANYGDGKFYGMEPKQFRATVEAAGLCVISSHATRGLNDEELAKHDFTEALKWWKQAIQDHKAAGMKYIVTPWANVPKTLQEAQTICEYHNEVGRLCKEAGLLYGYHNHSHEFQKVEGQVWYDYFLSHTQPDLVFFQLDVFWCVMAQQAPVEYFKRYPGRFKMLHIKDKYEIGGSGMVGFDAIFRNAQTAGLQDYVVEIEGTDGTMDILQACQISSKFLNRARAVKDKYSK